MGSTELDHVVCTFGKVHIYKKRGVLYFVTRNFAEPKLGSFCIIFWIFDFAYLFHRVVLGQFQRQSISFFKYNSFIPFPYLSTWI
jgi:hypothetical protein